jgi:MoaA/NifB/PqqE/SkfB family radical SAM enzyme
MTGNGDPLASAIMRPLLHNYIPPENQTIRLFTNGLLLEKQLSDNPIVKNITQYFISIDAGSKEVYERVRLGGQHRLLLKNFDFLRGLVDSTGASVLLKFVLQRDNWADMEPFVLLCKRYNFNGVINRLEDWGTWDDFSAHDVIGNIQHTEHVLAVAELKRVYKLYHRQIQFNPSLKDLANELN